MLYLYHEFGGLSPTLWLSVGMLSVLMPLCAVFYRARTELVRSIALCSVVFLSAGLGTSLTWGFAYQAVTRHEDRDRALERRIREVKEQATIPGSPFACLDPAIGDSMQTMCEKEVFASPAVVASEIAYVRSQFDLLSDIKAQRAQSVVLKQATFSLRQSLEADRFGFFAYLLMTQDGCTPQKCKPLEMLADPNHIKLNLIANTFDQYVANYRKTWSQDEKDPSKRPPVLSDLGSGQAAQLRKKVWVDIDFPSAASIPAVHIMTPDEAATKAPPVSIKNDPRTTPAAGNPQATLSSPYGGAYPVWTPIPSPAASNGNMPVTSSSPMHLNPFGQ